MVEVSAGLWLGSEADAEALVSGGRLSRKLPITHILSVTIHPPKWLEQPRQTLLHPRPSPSDDVTAPIDDVIPSEEKENLHDESSHEGVGKVENSESEGQKSDARAEEENTEGAESGPPKLNGDSEKAGEARKVEKARFSTMFVKASDSPRTDLLHQFESCCQFIKQGVEQGGGVLVHCVYGVSRSATVVLAYLMWAEGRSLRVIQREILVKKPDIRPNDGFIEQLELWGAMRCRLDTGNKRYKDYRLKHMANTLDFKDTKCVETEVKNAMSADPSTCTLTSDAYYRCRKCRRLLFTEESVLPHRAGEGEAAFKWHKRTHKPPFPGGTTIVGSGPQPCSSLFVEPVEWMQELLLGTTEGKVLCPKCSSRLGSFNWAGQQCSCGQWVNPSFQIHRNKVDETRTLLRRVPHHHHHHQQGADSAL